MVGVIFCIVSIGLGNFGVEALFREVPNYSDALSMTWSQLWAIGIYYMLWAKK